jgi:hypothetical protein
VALCPVYQGNPVHLVNNAIECFLRQDYPADRRHLVVFDDTNHFRSSYSNGEHAHWHFVYSRRRTTSLPGKYNILSRMMPADIYAVWEADDIYLPWHISAGVTAMEEEDLAWSKPSQVWTDYAGPLGLEDASGRFHGSLLIDRDLLYEVRWPDTLRSDYDQMFMKDLTSCVGRPADPCEHGCSSYCFRWTSTQSVHGESFSTGPADTEWYERAGRLKLGKAGTKLSPCLDADTIAKIADITSRCQEQPQ